MISVILILDVITFLLTPLTAMMEAIAPMILAIHLLDVFTYLLFVKITIIAQPITVLSSLDVIIHHSTVPTYPEFPNILELVIKLFVPTQWVDAI
jgi:hypothetical protein